MSSIQPVEYHGFQAFKLENEHLRVVVAPETGARIVSLFDKVRGCEWLLTPEDSHPYRFLEYGSDFNTTTPGGIDEMFPAILGGPYPAPGAYAGISLPDHGEVWTLPWEAATLGEAGLCCVVEGRALPYRLERSLTLTGEQSLHLSYRLTNTGSQAFIYLWAFHPQFACEEGARILLPDQVKEVINALPLEWGREWGEPGTLNAWPVKTLHDGRQLRQDEVASAECKKGRKFYIQPEAPVSWAGLVRPSKGCSLRMEWDASQLPYCGVWIDEGALNSRPSVAIEPTTGYYDSLSVALQNGRVSEIGAGETKTWELDLTLDKGM